MDEALLNEYWIEATQEAQARSYDLERIGSFKPATDQIAFKLVPAWKADPQLLPTSLRGTDTITRGDLFSLAAKCRSGNTQWTELLKGVFVWGWAQTSLGPGRLRRVLENTHPKEIENRLSGAITTLDTRGPIAAYWGLNNYSTYKIKNLGPSFFTKFLYFADSKEKDVPALILDRVAASNLNDITTPRGTLQSTGWTTKDYAFYLAVLTQLTARLRTARPEEDWTPDSVELALFTSQETTSVTSP